MKWDPDRGRWGYNPRGKCARMLPRINSPFSGHSWHLSHSRGDGKIELENLGKGSRHAETSISCVCIEPCGGRSAPRWGNHGRRRDATSGIVARRRHGAVDGRDHHRRRRRCQGRASLLARSRLGLARPRLGLARRPVVLLAPLCLPRLVTRRGVHQKPATLARRCGSHLEQRRPVGSFGRSSLTPRSSKLSCGGIMRV
jgi:hypothetical protein